MLDTPQPSAVATLPPDLLQVRLKRHHDARPQLPSFEDQDHRFPLVVAR